jgi:hypothetical protein
MTESGNFPRRSPLGLIGCVIALGIAAGVLSSIGWIWRQPLLEQIAFLWTVSNPTVSADAVVILGGGVEHRSKIAADIFKKGLVKRILISDVLDSSHAIGGGHASDTAISREMLRRYEVPDEAVETFGSANQNTQKEALALAEWSKRNSATSFIIPTEFLFSRRVRWIFNRELAGRARISVISFETPDYNHKNWWKTEEGQHAFKIEMLKLAYYHILY